MRAMVYRGPGRPSWEDVPKPEIIDDGDVVVRVDAVTICGTELHILKGDMPEVSGGRILGHEAVGTIEEIGPGVATMQPGDQVLVSCISACGTCRFCREGHYGQCLRGGGWILGHTIDGTQAEYVRVPFADTSVYRVPDGVPAGEVLMLSDIVPTGYEVGVLNGGVGSGDMVVVVGAGPIGLAAIMTARLLNPAHIVALDVADARLETAELFGADHTINNGREDPRPLIMELTEGLGADVTIEAVGIAETFELAVALARPGGRIANIGVHGHPVTLHLEEQWIRNITITTGLADTYTIPMLLRLIAGNRMQPGRFITHEFDLDDFPKAYETFANAIDTGALKVLLTR
jgi:alcohol dehydrogenase